MALRLQQFDPALRRDLPGIIEVRENTLAEYFFPKHVFKTAVIDPDTARIEDLRGHKGLTLEFAAGKRLYFANAELREHVYPVPSDGAAYGSLLFTPCQQFHELRARLLVVDDVTGATAPSPDSDIIPRNEAKRLVGDCHGKVAWHLADSFSNEPNRPFQFRLGIKPQGHYTDYRIAKGTLAPQNLDTLTSTVREDTRPDGTTRYHASYDMVLPTSAFKGRKGDLAIAPGEYLVDIGLGIKTYAYQGMHRLGTQVLVNYPKGVRADIVPMVQESVQNLRECQADPYKIATNYVQSYDTQREYAENAGKGTVHSNAEIEDALDRMLAAAFGADTVEQPEPLGYRIVKADLERHGQLLDHPFVVDELRQFVRREWENAAFGRSIKFTAGLAQPSHDLKLDEVCVPWLPKGEEVIVLRSPVLNSNGVILLKNVELPEGKRLDGCIWIHPDTAAKHLQADFDGDRLAVDLASKYPTLRNEIALSHTEEQRYPDVVKRAKVPYSGSFEEIALEAAHDKVGIIANRIQRAIALRWEAAEVAHLPDAEKQEYVREVARYYSKLIQPKGPDASPHPALASPYGGTIKALATLPPTLSPTQVDRVLMTLQDMQRNIVGELSSELQVAVDGFKSADRPNEQVLSYCHAVSAYRPVAWLDEKAIAKRGESPEKPYFSRPMESHNYSPIDLTIRAANAAWCEAPLTPAPSHKYRDLFPAPDASTQAGRELLEKARSILSTDREHIAHARTLQDLIAADPALGRHYFTLTTKGERTVYITNVHRYGGITPPVSPSQAPLPVRLVASQNENGGKKQLLAVVPRNDAEGRAADIVLGTVSPISVKQHDLQAGKSFFAGNIAPSAPITRQVIDGLYRVADDYRQSIRNATPQEDRPALAAAIWNATFTKQDNATPALQTKKGRSAFALFPEEVIARLEEPQFTRLQVSGLRREMNEHQGRTFDREKMVLEVGTRTFVDEGTMKQGITRTERTILLDGLNLGTIAQDSPTLQPGTKAIAHVTTDPPTSVLLSTDRGELKVNQIKNYDYADTVWKGDTKVVSAYAPPHGRGTVLALVDGKPLGVFDRSSVTLLKEGGFSSPSRNSFKASLQTPPPSTARIVIDPHSLVYPWEQAVLRREYETLRHDAERTLGKDATSHLAVDRAVAILASTQYPDSTRALLVLSQSDQLREWKGTMPPQDYLQTARQYVGAIWKETHADVSREAVERSPGRGMEMGR